MAKLKFFLQNIALHTQDFDILLEESLKEQNTSSWKYLDSKWNCDSQRDVIQVFYTFRYHLMDNFNWTTLP